MTTPRSVFGDPPLVPIDLFEKSKAGERPPGIQVPYEAGQSKGFAEIGLEPELDRKEGDVGERRLESRRSWPERDVLGLDDWESGLLISDMICILLRKSHRGSLGDVDSPDRPVVVGECEDVSPVSVLDEKRLEQCTVACGSGSGEAGEPVLGYSIHVVLGICGRFEALGVRWEVGWVGYGSFKDHFGRC